MSPSGFLGVGLSLPCLGRTEPTCATMCFLDHQRAPAHQASVQTSCLPGFHSIKWGNRLGVWGGEGGARWHQRLTRDVGGTFLTPSEPLSPSLRVSKPLSQLCPPARRRPRLWNGSCWRITVLGGSSWWSYVAMPVLWL